MPPDHQVTISAGVKIPANLNTKTLSDKPHRRFPRARAFPALCSAIATACRCGYPARRNSRTFAETTFADRPRFNGITASSEFHAQKSAQKIYAALQRKGSGESARGR